MQFQSCLPCWLCPSGHRFAPMATIVMPIGQIILFQFKSLSHMTWSQFWFWSNSNSSSRSCAFWHRRNESSQALMPKCPHTESSCGLAGLPTFPQSLYDKSVSLSAFGGLKWDIMAVLGMSSNHVCQLQFNWSVELIPGWVRSWQADRLSMADRQKEREIPSEKDKNGAETHAQRKECFALLSGHMEEFQWFFHCLCGCVQCSHSIFLFQFKFLHYIWM